MQQWVWYAENAGIDTAEEFLSAFWKAVNHLAVHPASGRALVSRRRHLKGLRREAANRDLLEAKSRTNLS